MRKVSGIDLNLLVTLAAVLDEQNLTKAGERIHISQPAMSAALGRLRRHFGDELLVRDGRFFRLTPLAEQLLPDVRAALRQVERTLEVRPEFDAGTSTRTFSLAMSDYATAVLGRPLASAVAEVAPSVKLELNPIPGDALESDRVLLQYDLLIAPMSSRFPGRCEEVFRDRFVCIVAPGNPRLADGRLSIADLDELPHAAPRFGSQHVPNSARQVLDTLRVPRRIHVTTVGWLPVPFVVAGTDLVAVVPERVASMLAAKAGVAVCEPPFGKVAMVEGAWWHPTRTGNPALRWLRQMLLKAADAV